jgi:hypothetical protein
MRSSQPLQVRWIWVSVYIISGCLFLAYSAFAAIDALPNGVFYTGFAGAGFVGAMLATAHSGGASVTETSIAAVVVGLLHLGLLIFGFGSDASDVLPQLAEPLSTTFVCFVGALAGGQLATRGRALQSAESLPRLSTTAMLVLIGATASHAAALVILGSVSAPLALSLGIFLLFTTPAIAGYALQLATSKDVTPAFLYGIAAAGLASLLLLVAHHFAFDWHLFCKGIMFAAFIALFGGFTLVLILPGILVAQTSGSKHPPRGARLPKALARIAAHGATQQLRDAQANPFDSRRTSKTLS